MTPDTQFDEAREAAFQDYIVLLTDREDEIRSMALFAMCFAALSGFIVGVLVGVVI